MGKKQSVIPGVMLEKRSAVARSKKRERDPLLTEVRAAFEKEFGADALTAYRYNSASTRVRAIDPQFHRLGVMEREARVKHILDELSDEAISDLTVLLLVSPNEAKKSPMSAEFDALERSPL